VSEEETHCRDQTTGAYILREKDHDGM